MAITRRACTIAFLLMCLALASCEATGIFDALAAVKKAKDIARGIVDPTEKVFNVLEFGVKLGDKEKPVDPIEGDDRNREGFVKAFRAACLHPGKAKLLVPKGTYVVGPVTFMGPCKNPAPLIVHIQGHIKGHTDISLYPGQGEEWINFESINGLIVTGDGTFDGQGPAAWKYCDTKHDNEAPGQRLPANVQFVNVTNAIVRGIKSLNSKGFHFFITQSHNIRLHHINISAPDTSPNTDGIHISQSSLVKIAKSSIRTGDDCVGIIRGCRDISVNKITCGPGHGISVGSLGKYDNEMDVRGIVVNDCILVGTQNGLRIKTNVGKSPSQATGMTFQNIIMKDVKHPIIIDQFYESKDKDSIVKISDIRFKNITGTSVSKVAVDLACSKQFPCKNVHLSNINLKYSGEQSDLPFSSSCVNAQVAYQGLQFPPPCR